MSIDLNKYTFKTGLLASSENWILIKVNVVNKKTKEEISVIEGGAFEKASLVEDKAIEKAISLLESKE